MGESKRARDSIESVGEGEVGKESENELVDSSPPAKKARQSEEYTLGNVISLLVEKNSLLAGLTCFLKGVVQFGDEDEVGGAGAELLCGYLSQYPECQHLTQPLEWDRDKRTMDVMLLCFKCLEQVLLFTSAPPTTTTPTSARHYRTTGHRLVQRLLANHMRCVYHTLLSTQPMKLVQSSLRLLTAMVMQGAESAKQVQLVFNFAYKPLETFFNRTTPISDLYTGNAESVRQSFVKFALSFLVVGDASVISALLELKGSFLSGFFKLLAKDDAPIISLFLATILDKVVRNSGLSKKPKSLFFNQFALKQISLLLTYSVSVGLSADEEATEHVQDLSFRLLITLCTDFQYGICYRAKDIPFGLEKTNNPVLLHFLLYLSGRLDTPTSQDIILRTLSCCPDLFISYFRSLGLNFEPQPSPKWTENMTFLTKVYTSFLSVPCLLSGAGQQSDDTTAAAALQPATNLVGVAVSLTTPLSVTRAQLSLGLQHPSPLVKYCTLHLIKEVLERACCVVDTWGPIKKNLVTISSFLVQFCDTVLKYLPDVRTVISLRQRLQQQQKGGVEDGGRGVAGEEEEEEAQTCVSCSMANASLSCVVLEILCGFQKLSPDVFQQVKFQPAKLLPPVPLVEPVVGGAQGGGEAKEGLMDEERREELCLTLKINISAYMESFCQNAAAMWSALWLTQSSDCQVSGLACALIRKILNGGQASSLSSPDADILVLSLSSVSSVPGVTTASLVKMAASAVSAYLLDRHRLREEVREVIGKRENGSASLQEILESPDCDIEIKKAGVGGVNSGQDHVMHNRLMFASSFLSKFTSSEESLWPFLHHLLTRFLLVSSPLRSRQLVTLTRHHLPHTQHRPTSTIMPTLARLLCPEAKISSRSRADSRLDSNPELEEWVLELCDVSWHAAMREKMEACVDFSGCGQGVELMFLIQALWAAIWRLYDVSKSLESSMCMELSQAMLKLFELTTVAVELISTRPELIHGSILDVALVQETFLDPGAFSLKTKTRGDSGRRRRSKQSRGSSGLEGIVSEYSTKMADFVVFVLDKLSSVPALVGDLKAVAIGKVSSFARDVIGRNADPVCEQAGIVAVEVVARFHHYSLALLPMVTELLSSDCGGGIRSVGTLAAIVKAVLSTGGSGSDGNSDGGTAEVVLDDSTLVSLLEWVMTHSCYDLVDVAHRLLRQRTLNSGLTLTPSRSQSSGSGLVGDITLVARTLLVSDPSPPNNDVSIPIRAVKKSIPFHPENPLAVLLSCLDSAPPSAPCTLTSDHPPLVVKEDSIFGVMRLCVKGSGLPCARLLLLLCHAASSPSPRAVREWFRTSCLAEVCRRVEAGEGEELQVALCVIGGYLEDLVAGCKHEGGRSEARGVANPGDAEVEMTVKTVRKKVLGKCVDIVLNADSAWPKEQQEAAGLVLKSLAALSPKALKKLRKASKKCLRSDRASRSALQVCSVVAVESEDDEELCCLLVARVLPKLREMFTGQQQGEEKGREGETTLMLDMCRVLESNRSLTMDTALLGSGEWKKFLFACLKSRFTSCHALHLLSLLLPVVYRNGNRKNRHPPLGVVYDMVLSHSEFIGVMCTSCDQKAKEFLVELLISVVELCPSVCKTSHILTFLSAYSATRSRSDRGLLYLIAKYEENDAPSGEFSPFLWGEAALEQHRLREGMYRRPPDISDIIKLLDTPLLLRSSSAFPVDVELEPYNPFVGTDETTTAGEVELYDLCFLLPLFSHYLALGAHVDCRSFVGHGCVGFLFVALSSRHEKVRVAAGHALTRFRVHLEESKFREKPQISLLVEVLRNSVHEDSFRLTSVWTSFASKAALLFMHADSPEYSMVSRYTVHKPSFHLRDVPLLFPMLHSSSAEGCSEQLWLLKVLVDGLRCKEDFRFYEKHKVFSHVTSLAGSGMLDQRAMELAKELLRRGSKVNIPYASRTK